MQLRTELVHIDHLAVLTGSRVRADVLAVLYVGPTRAWSVTDVGRAARRRHQVVDRELKRLAAIGLVRVTAIRPRRLYQAELTSPIARELARFVWQTRGRVPLIRRALETLRSPVLAWEVRAQAVLQRFGPEVGRRDHLDLIVLTGAPRSLVRLQLAGAIGPEVALHCMSIREWVARLQRADVFIRRARRARKEWIVGSWEELTQRERSQLDSVRNLRTASANWREELTDDWDEDWEPISGPGNARA